MNRYKDRILINIKFKLKWGRSVTTGRQSVYDQKDKRNTRSIQCQLEEYKEYTVPIRGIQGVYSVN